MTVTATPDGPSRDDITRELRLLFDKRLYELSWTEPERLPDGKLPPGIVAHPSGCAATVRQFLAGHPQLAGDKDKDAVLALANTFLSDNGGAA